MDIRFMKFPGLIRNPPTCCISQGMSPCISEMGGIFTAQALPGISAAYTAVWLKERPGTDPIWTADALRSEASFHNGFTRRKHYL